MKWIVHQSDRRAFQLFRNKATFEFSLGMRAYTWQTVLQCSLQIIRFDDEWQIQKTKKNKRTPIQSYVFSNICFGMNHTTQIHMRVYVKTVESQKKI